MKNETIDQVKAKLKEVIAKNLDANIDVNDISDEASLYEDGLGLDSITIVNLIVQIESTFDFTFEHEEINSALFKNINSLGDFITSKLEKSKNLI